MATALQASLLVRHSPPAVADAFCASRLAGDGGLAYGTLPAGIDTRGIVDRPPPAGAQRPPRRPGTPLSPGPQPGALGRSAPPLPARARPGGARRGVPRGGGGGRRGGGVRRRRPGVAVRGGGAAAAAGEGERGQQQGAGEGASHDHGTGTVIAENAVAESMTLVAVTATRR